MLGAIIGDVVGSRFEFDNYKGTDFTLFTPKCRPTDDSIMSLAIAKAILEAEDDYNDLAEKAVYYMQKLGRQYPNAGYGTIFKRWLAEDKPQPYGSYGNGSAMRISPVAFAACDLPELKFMCKSVTAVTHNHPEGLKGAEAVAVAIFLARQGKTKEIIRETLSQYYTLDFTLDEIRAKYRFDATCQGSVPQALEAFLESTGFEDAIRKAVSIGGDSDTIAAMTGSIAEAYYGIPYEIRTQVLPFLNQTERTILDDFEGKYGCN